MKPRCPFHTHAAETCMRDRPCASDGSKEKHRRVSGFQGERGEWRTFYLFYLGIPEKKNICNANGCRFREIAKVTRKKTIRMEKIEWHSLDKIHRRCCGGWRTLLVALQATVRPLSVLVQAAGSCNNVEGKIFPAQHVVASLRNTSSYFSRFGQIGIS